MRRAEPRGTVDELVKIRWQALRYLRLVGGPGANREHVRALREAIDRAVVDFESEHAPDPQVVRPGEHPSDDPVWRTQKGEVSPADRCAGCSGPRAAHGQPGSGDPCLCAMPDARPCGCTEFVDA